MPVSNQTCQHQPDNTITFHSSLTRHYCAVFSLVGLFGTLLSRAGIPEDVRDGPKVVWVDIGGCLSGSLASVGALLIVGPIGVLLGALLVVAVGVLFGALPVAGAVSVLFSTLLVVTIGVLF